MKKSFASILVLAGILTVIFYGRDGLSSAERFPAFSTRDLNGGAVTDAVFAENKITMLNFWATWCGPCVGEMADLGELARELPEGAGLIGVLVDARDNGAMMKAGQILRGSDADFPQIVTDSGMDEFRGRSIQAIPTSVLVDADGNIAGPLIVGARSKDFYLDAIKQAMK